MSTVLLNSAIVISIIIAVVIVLGLIIIDINIDIAGSPNRGYCKTR